MTKKQVSEYVGGGIDLEQMLDDLIRNLMDLRAQHGPTAFIQMQTDCYSDSDRAYPQLYISREETDAEYAERLKRERTTQLKQEQVERETLTRLQGKYGIVSQPS